MKKVNLTNHPVALNKMLVSAVLLIHFCSFEAGAKTIKTDESKPSDVFYGADGTVAVRIFPNKQKDRENDTLKVTAASTVKALMKLVEPAFESSRKGFEIAQTIGATGDMVEMVMANKASVAITTRNIKDYEKLKCPTLSGTPIGLDGLALVVSASLPVTNLTFGQIQAIWTGVIVNWKELGGPDLPIVLIGRSKSYDSIMLFCDFMKLESKPIEGGLIYREKNKEVWCEKVIAAPETDDLALAVLLQTPGAITYFPLQILNNYKAKSFAVKSVSFDGIQPTKESIANGTYFIHRTLNAITNNKPQGKTKEFCDFLLSKKGQKLIVEAGFLALKS